MQYLLSVIHDRPDLAPPEEMAAIATFNERLKAEGHWVFAGGLGAPVSATVIDNRGESAMLTDGPFLESKEYLAASGSSRRPISTWRSSSPPRGRRPATGRSRCGRSCRFRPPVDRSERGDHP